MRVFFAVVPGNVGSILDISGRAAPDYVEFLPPFDLVGPRAHAAVVNVVLLGQDLIGAYSRLRARLLDQVEIFIDRAIAIDMGS